MNPYRYFMPYSNMINPMNYASYMVPNRMGLLGRITNGIKGFNWSGMLTNANKTLNVVNQTIPLVRQAGPMFNNMKSMLRLTKAFGNETSNNNKKVTNEINNVKSNNETFVENVNIKNNFSNSPNFFI